MNISRFSLGAYTADQLANMPVSTVNGCPVVNLASNACKLGPNIVGCNAIQECDALTGATHFQYALPTFATSGNPNPNLAIAPVGTPISNATFAPLMGNAPGLTPSTPASSQPTASQVSAAASEPVSYAGPVPVSSSGGSSPQGNASSSSSTNSSSTATGTDWLTQSMFGGIPNWGLLAGALALGWMFIGGRR